jgi:hypothetical protein
MLCRTVGAEIIAGDVTVDPTSMQIERAIRAPQKMVQLGLRKFASVLALSVLLTPTSGKLVMTAVIPHGDFAFDPTLLTNKTQRAAAEKVHVRCRSGTGTMHGFQFAHARLPDFAPITIN